MMWRKRMRYLLSAWRLRFRVYRLARALKKRGIRCNINVHYRAPAKAHRFSTAYHIATGQIRVGSLRALAHGCDSNGHQWIKPEWAIHLTDAQPANLCPFVVNNATALAPEGLPYAEEGYEKNDPKRAPNTSDAPVSKHVYGLAIDLNVDWKQLDGEWGAQTNAFIAQFGLCRPQKAEWWHVELLQ